MPAITAELAYISPIFGLMVVPRVLQRFRIPAPLTSFGLGMLAVAMLSGGTDNATLSLLATLGMSSLFLFAGLEIDVPGLRRGLRELLIHLGLRSLTLAAVAFGTVQWLGMSWQTSLLLALAPTLIFTLVLATILRERFGLPDDWYGALWVYAALTTLLPSLTRTFSLDASDVGAALAERPAASPVARQAPVNSRQRFSTVRSRTANGSGAC